MIKASFDTLRKAYAKLFNLALTVEDVPNIWCKGLITPVFKNGDAFNQENYRPICVLSCLCKFFTNALISGCLNLQKDVRLLTMFRLAFLRITEQLIIFSLLNQSFLRMSQIQLGEMFIAVLLISKKLLILFGMKTFSRSSWK